MSDLGQKYQAEFAKLVGTNPATGDETEPVTVTTVGTKNGIDTYVINPISANAISGPGVEGEITVGTTAVEVKVGASRLVGRVSVTLTPVDFDMYWGYTSGVTTATGTPIFRNQMGSWDVLDTATIYVVCSVAGKKARVTESK